MPSVSTRRALIVSAGSPHRPGVAGLAHADGDAWAISKVLSALIPPDRLTTCIGPDATTAVVAHRFRTLIKRLKSTDELIVWLAGTAVDAAGRVVLPCWDALPEATTETGINLVEWLAMLGKSKAKSVVVFMDIVHPLDLPTAANIITFASASPTEQSHATGTPSAGIWASLVREAFAGRLPAAITDDNRLTTASLEQFFSKEFRRKLRAELGPSAVQTPFTTGDEEIELAKFDGAAGTRFGKAEWSRIRFEGISRSKVKDLAGYRKTFQMPDRVTPRANQFFGRVAIPEIKADLDERHAGIIEAFSYRRKDVSRSQDDGSGSIRTPDFEYLLSVELDPDQPGQLLWRRAIGQIIDPALVRSPAFQESFGSIADRLIFDFDKPTDVAAFIERYEDRPLPGSRMTADPDGAWCEINLGPAAGSIRVESQRLIVRGKLGDTDDLLAALFRFMDGGSPGAALAVRG